MYGGSCARSTTTLTIAVVLVLTAWMRAGANEPPPPASSDMYCAIAVAAAVPIETSMKDSDPEAGPPTITIAFFLATHRADGKKSFASGTLAIFVGEERYNVPFADAVAVARPEELAAATPIVVRFQDGSAPTGAYIAALGGAGGVRCSIGNPWTFGRRVGVDTSVLRAAAQGAPVTEAPSPVLDPAPSCPQPNQDVIVTYPALPVIPAGIQGQEGIAQVTVFVGANSQIVDASIYRSSGMPLLDRAALDSALGSKYRAEMFRCRPVAGTYLYRVMLGVGPG